MSSGRLMRRNGIMSYSGLRSPISFWPMGVPTRPDMIPFTRIWGARSAAACRVRELIAPFEMEYAPPPGLDRSPEPAEMLRIAPPALLLHQPARIINDHFRSFPGKGAGDAESDVMRRTSNQRDFILQRDLNPPGFSW